MFRELLATLLLAASATAQFLHVSNTSGGRFDGWIRTTTDVDLPPATKLDRVLIVRGRPLGLQLWSVDVRVALEPGETLGYKLVSLQSAPWRTAPVAADALKAMGQPSLAGAPLSVKEVTLDGAGYFVHLAGRVRPMLHADLWLKHYPDQPGIACGELVLCASNASLPDLQVAVPEDLTLRFGEAAVIVLGLPAGPLMPAGDAMADGQAKSWPVTVVWPRLLRDFEWSTAGALSNLQIGARGLTYTWPGGNPLFPGSVREWVQKNTPPAIASLHSWSAALGVNPRSGDTGAQEDQFFVGGEASVPGADLPRYLAALGQSRRPCHHLESSGELIRLSDRPQLKFWEGRAHWHRGVSPDQLGKRTTLSIRDVPGGWWGPDEEHLLYNSVVVSYRLRGSPALQWQLEHAARHLLAMPRGRVGAARAIGYRGWLASHLWRNLADRKLAQQVRAFFLDHFATELLPALTRAGDIWDVREDPRLGPGRRYMAWQLAVGAGGLWAASTDFDSMAGQDHALAAAKRVLTDAYVQTDAGWRAYYTVAVDGGAPAFGASDWSDFGTPMAAGVVLLASRGDPMASRASSVWDQLVARGSWRWLSPTVFSRQR